MIELMLDIESLGQQPGSVVLSVGVVPFDEYEVKTHLGFYQVISLQSSLDAGLKIDASTLAWWLDQGSGLKDLVNDPEQISLKTAVTRLNDYAKKFPRDITWWANGSTFDFPLLEAAIRTHWLELPWRYNKIRDMRTLFQDRQFNYDKPKYFNDGECQHNAFHDACAQARAIIDCRQA